MRWRNSCSASPVRHEMHARRARLSFYVTVAVVASSGCSRTVEHVDEPSEIVETLSPAPEPEQASAPEPEQAPAPNSASAPEPAPGSWSTSSELLPLFGGRVLLTTDARPGWAEGPMRAGHFNQSHETWTLERHVDRDALPLELRAYADMQVDLYGPTGQLCSARLSRDLFIEAHVLDDHGVKWDDLGLNAEATLLLLTEIIGPPDCIAKALWARDASLPAPRVLVPADTRTHAKLLRREHRRVLESEVGAKLERDLDAYATDIETASYATPWAEFSVGRRAVWVDDTGAPQVVTLDFGSHAYAPCIWHGPTLSVVRSLAHDEDLTPGSSQPAPLAIVDADLDGRWELLIIEDGGDFDLVHVASETPALRVDLSLPDHAWAWC